MCHQTTVDTYASDKRHRTIFIRGSLKTNFSEEGFSGISKFARCGVVHIKSIKSYRWFDSVSHGQDKKLYFILCSIFHRFSAGCVLSYCGAQERQVNYHYLMYVQHSRKVTNIFVIKVSL